MYLPQSIKISIRTITMLFLLCIVAPTAAQDSATQRPENFFAMSDHYDSLSFSPGETHVIASPDPNAYLDMTVPTLNGRLRLGIQSTFVPQYGLRSTPSASARNKVAERLGWEAETYAALLALQYMEEDFSDENILQNDRNRGMTLRYKKNGSLVPRGYLAILAMNLLQRNEFNRYFCNGHKSCESSYRNVLGFGNQMLLNKARAWGRDADEFASRAAVEHFLEKHKQTLFSWSKSLSRDITLVDMAALPEYDFDKQGFDLELNMIRQNARSSSHLRYSFIERSSAPTRYLTPTRFTVRAFIPMMPDDAEALLEELKATFGRGNIYYVLEGRFTNIAWNEPELRQHDHALIYALTSPKVAFFKDAALRQPIATVELTPQ